MGKFNDLYFNDTTSAAAAINKPIIERTLKRKFGEGHATFKSMIEQNDEEIDRLMGKIVNGEMEDLLVKQIIGLRIMKPELIKQDAELTWLEGELFGAPT
jgi:hypothetical protein